MKKLYKSNTNKQICGVCGGLAEYLDIDATVLRILTVMLFFAGTISFWVYIIAAILIPSEPEYSQYDVNQNYYNRNNNQNNDYMQQ